MKIIPGKYYFICALTLIPIFLTISHDVIDIDSAQYAEIGREMVGTNNFFELKDNGKNYLDKPILTFWTIALFYKIFGISNFSYRLPSIIFTLLSFYSVYRITVLISSSQKRGILAAITYAVTPGVYAMVIDPKIDVYLVAYLTFIFHTYYLGVKKNHNWFYLMYLFISMGFITKGPISMVIPGIAIGGDILLRRDWELLGKMKIIPGVFIIASLPAFWSYLLYLEFASHGPVFFLWIQSFGRFYRQMYNQKYDPLFFITNFSWAFGAFILCLYYICFVNLKNYFQNTTLKKFPGKVFDGIKVNQSKEAFYVIPLWLFAFIFFISFSRYQLPQYIYWALPAGAIFISKYLEEYLNRESELEIFKNSTFNILLMIVPVLLIVSVLLIPFFVIEVTFSYVLTIVIFTGIVLYFYKKIPLQLNLALLSPVLFFCILSLNIYPELISYQPSSKIGELIKKLEPEKKEIFTYKIPFSKRSYGYYSSRLTRPIFDREKFIRLLKKDSERLVILSSEDLDKFKIFLINEYKIIKIVEYPSYKVSTPKNTFFLKTRRKQLTKNILLIKILYLPEYKFGNGNKDKINRI